MTPPLPPFTVVLVAAGASTRMGFPKLRAEVGGQPLLAYALSAAHAVAPAELVVVVAADQMATVRDLIDSAPGRQGAAVPATRVVVGGLRRRDSVAAGLAAATSDWLAIHDAARAFAPSALFLRGLHAAQASGAAIPGVPLNDTIKRVVGDLVVGTPPRSEHVAVQTPQIFRRDLLARALALTDDDVTDEATLIERLGIPVRVFAGDEAAFKVTTPLDLALAKALAARRACTE